MIKVINITHAQPIGKKKVCTANTSDCAASGLSSELRSTWAECLGGKKSIIWMFDMPTRRSLASLSRPSACEGMRGAPTLGLPWWMSCVGRGVLVRVCAWVCVTERERLKRECACVRECVRERVSAYACVRSREENRSHTRGLRSCSWL